MLVDLFHKLRSAGVPASLTEYLMLMEAMQARVASVNIDDFYHLARVALVKDERHYDRFDRVFGAHFQGVEAVFQEVVGEIPADWLRSQAELQLSEEEMRQIEALGGWDQLMKTLAQRLQEQDGRHEGGSKWIGTAGRSPFGANGYNPEGVRIGQETSRHRRAVKVWDQRAFRNLDDTVELGTRNIKVALRRLRAFARSGAAEELDLDDTIRSTARNAGYLELKMVPERHNAVKVLLFLDVGGSMDDHVRVCTELFSASRSEFKNLEYYYFHNFLYESVWKDNRRRLAERIPLPEVMNTYGPDYKLIFVGDATMSPYEISQAGGSVEHYNEIPGAAWFRSLLERYPGAIWLNPELETRWPYSPSVGMVRELIGERMFPLTIEGLERGIKALQRRH
jgi:uncharacterized protein with von Willebrand factor type A (vWA) domain